MARPPVPGRRSVIALPRRLVRFVVQSARGEECRRAIADRRASAQRDAADPVRHGKS